MAEEIKQDSANEETVGQTSAERADAEAQEERRSRKRIKVNLYDALMLVSLIFVFAATIILSTLFTSDRFGSIFTFPWNTAEARTVDTGA